MLFSEIYGTYFNTVAGILKEAVKGTLTQQRMYEIIEQKGFGESMIRIPEASDEPGMAPCFGRLAHATET